MLEDEGSQWSFICAANLGQVYPAGEIGLASDSSILQAARNSIHLRSIWEKESRQWSQNWRPGLIPEFMMGSGAWNDFNQSCLFFPSAVRVGYDPEIIWNELKLLIETRGRPNGFLKNTPHGIENCSTVPNTINEMLLLSHENVLRFFKVWPRDTHPNARFMNLRAAGAFLVSADLINGIVDHVQIVSLKGQDCVLENPWPCKVMTIKAGDDLAVSTRSETLDLKTRCGEVYTLIPG
jgi:alpha-L-fucosidase 2